jgi:hypothetical protein
MLNLRVTKLKPDINSVEVHPQLSHIEHPVDGALVSPGSFQPTSPRVRTSELIL